VLVLSSCELSVVRGSVSGFTNNRVQGSTRREGGAAFVSMTGTLRMGTARVTIDTSAWPANAVINTVEVETTWAPTLAPTAVTSSPTAVTLAPTQGPTTLPTQAPSSLPTNYPTPLPPGATQAPTTPAPTLNPTQGPTNPPTDTPTQSPTRVPTEHPTSAPMMVSSFHTHAWAFRRLLPWFVRVWCLNSCRHWPLAWPPFSYPSAWSRASSSSRSDALTI
jgi:hypothetical protein